MFLCTPFLTPQRTMKFSEYVYLSLNKTTEGATYVSCKYKKERQGTHTNQPLFCINYPVCIFNSHRSYTTRPNTPTIKFVIRYYILKDAYDNCALVLLSEIETVSHIFFSGSS